MLNTVTRAGRRVPSFSPCALAVAGVLGLVCGRPAHAQTDAGGDSSLALGSVEIVGKKIGPLATRSVLSSVDILGAGLLRDLQVKSAWELFSRAPGVMLTAFGQGNESGKLSFRGFNGEGEVNAVKLLVDGVPSNDNGGGMPLIGAVLPLEIQQIEVVRGTNDPRYGLHTIAGNANIVTRADGNYGEARLAYGSFDTRQVQLVKGIEDGNWSQNYVFGYQDAGGYREHSRSDATTFAGKWFYSADDGRLRVGLSARHAEGNAQEPGYLTAADARDNPTASYKYAQSDGANRQLNQLSLHLDSELAAQLSLSAKAYMNTIRDQRWLRFSPAASQQERAIDETHYGFLGTLAYRPHTAALGGLKGFSIEGGVSAERQHDRSPRYNTVDQVRVSTARDQRFTFDTAGAYVQAVIKPVESLKLVPGFRIDKIDGSFSDPSKGVAYPIQDYGLIKQPKFSVVYSPSPRASLYANWGRSFQVGAGAAYQSNLNTLRPSLNDGWESGLKLTPRDWIDGRVALWEQRATDEVKRRLNDPSGDSENVGATRRRGVDVQLNVRPDQRSSVWLAYSRQRAKIDRPDPAAPATINNEIDHVPRHVYTAGVDFQATPALKLSAWGNGQGNYYLSTANTGGKFGGFVLLNASAKYQLSPAVALELQLKNLANRYYEYVWINDQTRHAPGDGRAAYLSANVTF
ncbi:TonB-dependent receptor [Janthinobacterium sp.]|uniref:TonB-dependent receptor n=1 Tax=Janthinobacterium sp. TaxID=1871054 RepID=UPI00293D4212|nr:TonB-dependent receptor [Janthinobacterium sp.]